MSDEKVKFAIAQYNFLVGDIEGNCKKIVEGIAVAKEQLNADCVVFSELAILGYPPEDLVFRTNIKTIGMIKCHPTENQRFTILTVYIRCFCFQHTSEILFYKTRRAYHIVWALHDNHDDTMAVIKVLKSNTSVIQQYNIVTIYWYTCRMVCKRKY